MKRYQSYGCHKNGSLRLELALITICSLLVSSCGTSLKAIIPCKQTMFHIKYMVTSVNRNLKLLRPISRSLSSSLSVSLSCYLARSFGLSLSRSLSLLLSRSLRTKLAEKNKNALLLVPQYVVLPLVHKLSYIRHKK